MFFKLILFFLSLFCFSCSSKFKSFIKNDTAYSIENVEFDSIDLNNDGNITKLEFKESKQNNHIDTTTPMVWFGVIMGITFILLFFSRSKSVTP